MPSLTELVQRVHDQLDFDPDLQQYKDSVVRRINHHYLEVCDNDHWLFLQKKTDVSLKKKVEGSATKTITIDSATPRRVKGSGTSFVSAMEGQTFTGPDGVEMTIGSVEDSTVLFLTDKYAAGAVSGSADWSIQFTRYALPNDCIEALGFMDRDDDRGRLRFIDRRREEIEFLDIDDTGEPFVVIEDDHLSMRPPFRAPILAPTKPTSPGAGLETGVKYEYRYTFLYEGRESPPSPPSTVTLLGPDLAIFVQGLEDTQYIHSGAKKDSRKQKRIYRRDVTNQGRYFKVADVESGDLVHTDEELLPSYAEDYDHVIYFIENGPRQMARFWYTADSDRDFEVRYHYRPPRMQADSDHPVFPVQYHQLLAYRVMQDIMLQHGAVAQSQLWAKRAEAMLKQMRNRYLSRTDRKFVRRGFDNRRASYRFSPPVKT